MAELIFEVTRSRRYEDTQAADLGYRESSP